jgi:sn-glycerol 3-phosphate transport system permease protein
MNAKILRTALVYFAVGLLALVMATPLVWALLASLRPPNEPFASGNVFFGSGFSLANYRRVLELAPFGRYYLNTLLQGSMILSGQLVTSSLAAFAFARWRFPGDRIIFTVILMHMMIPAAALLVGHFEIVSRLGLFDTFLGIALPFFGSAFGTFLFRQSFLDIPLDFVDAAEIDGCRWDQVLRYVYLPNASAAVAAFTVSSFSWRWNDFLWPLVITQSDRVRPITMGLVRFTQMGEIGAQWGLMAAATVLAILPLLILFISFRRQFMDGYLSSCLK